MEMHMCTCRSEASSGQLMVAADGEAAGGAGGGGSGVSGDESESR